MAHQYESILTPLHQDPRVLVCQAFVEPAPHLRPAFIAESVRVTWLTWPYGHGYTVWIMKTINAGRFKDQCLKILDTIARTKAPVVVTKRGRPVVKVVPYTEPANSAQSLAGSVLKESGNLFGTDEEWNADVS